MNCREILITACFSIVITLSTYGQKHTEHKSTKRIGGIVEYHLYVNDTLVNFTGKKQQKALAINGQIPAPTLRFTEGDSAVIHVHNGLKEEVSIHWHGVLLPNEADGVPYLTTPPIKAGITHTFRFRVIQHGTLWYHSHSAEQEQEGLYGPLVFYPANQKQRSNEEVLQISDWRNERGSSILRSLKRRNEWYAVKKKAVQSWGEAIVNGHFSDKVQMEWMRMPGADVSDVYYPVILMHGQPERKFDKYQKGDSVRLRLINGSAASYFWLQYSGGKMKVVAADGNDVKPVEVDKILIATAETYDVIIRIPDNGQYEFRATAQDITSHTSAFFGTGSLTKVKDIPKLDYMVLMNEMNRMTWMMKGMGMKMKMGLSMDMPHMDMEVTGMGHDGMKNMPKMDHKMDTGMKKEMDHSDPSHKEMNRDMKKDGHQKAMDTLTKGEMDHSMHRMKKITSTSDTVPGKKKSHGHEGMDMHEKDMQMNNMQGDTSRSTMLMNMMPRMKMTGFDFPQGNGKDVVLSYDMLRADTSTVLPAGRPWREVNITLSGNMSRFVWSINGKTLSEQNEKIMIRRGENVRLVFTNATMMEHPMHLHGHFFRVVNKQGGYAPMKHTFNINSMSTQVIEFAATEEKDWFLHCHTLYHMMAGMATIISYAGTESEVQKKYAHGFKMFKREHGGMLFPWANAAFHSQATSGTLVLSGRKLQIDEDWKWNWKRSYELETKVQYFLDKRQFFSGFVGAEFERNNVKDGKTLAETEVENIVTAGLNYTLPLLINAEARISHNGIVRFQLLREDLPLTTRSRLDIYGNTDKEYGGALRYILAKYLAVSANYDSDFGWGAGLSIIY